MSIVVRKNGRSRSSMSGARLVSRKVTPTVCSPAFTRMRGVSTPVRMANPRDSSVSQSNSLTRSPSTETSSFSPVTSPKAMLRLSMLPRTIG